MTRRWQADGTPLWRKLFSSSWWWYGEVNPDPASLPPLENRPKFWRGDVIAMTCMIVLMPLMFWLATELNARYWPFNHTTQYVGQIIETKYEHPQYRVELEDKSYVYIALPQQDMLGLPRKSAARPAYEWIESIDRLQRSINECSQGRLLLEIDSWKFTFKPFISLWGVRCALGSKVLLSEKEVIEVFEKTQQRRLKFLFGVISSGLIFCLVLIIRRERKRYVKS